MFPSVWTHLVLWLLFSSMTHFAVKSQPWPADITVLQRFITLCCDRRLVYISSLAAAVHTLVPPRPYFTPLIKGSFSLGAVAAVTRSKEKQASLPRPAVRKQVDHSPAWCSTLSHGTHSILFGQMFWQLTAVPKYLCFIFSVTSVDVKLSRQGQSMLMTMTSSTFMPLWRNEVSSLEWNTLKTATKVAKQMYVFQLAAPSGEHVNVNDGAGSSSFKLPLKNTEEDKEEIQETTTSLAAANEQQFY